VAGQGQEFGHWFERGAAMRFEINLSLPQEAVSVPLARRAVASVLEQAGLASECLYEVKVALSEACTNVLDHAASQETYRVSIAIDDDVLHMDVTDSGGGVDHGGNRPTMPDPYADRGRGSALMAALVDSVNFDAVTTGGTTVHMTKQLSWSTGAPPWRAR
jgi:serine/threonine-protein kinase RsbW